jgi:hypothetical protein
MAITTPQAVITDVGFGDVGQQYAAGRVVVETFSLDGITSAITYSVAA